MGFPVAETTCPSWRGPRNSGQFWAGMRRIEKSRISRSDLNRASYIIHSFCLMPSDARLNRRLSRRHGVKWAHSYVLRLGPTTGRRVPCISQKGNSFGLKPRSNLPIVSWFVQTGSHPPRAPARAGRIGKRLCA